MPGFVELLLQARLASAPQVSVAERDARIRGKRLAPALIDLGIIDERRFAEWVAGVTELPIIEPLPENAVNELHRRIPRGIAREYEVVPVALSGETLTVAMVNPLDTAALEVLRTTTGLAIQPVVAVYGALMQLVSRFYPEDSVEATMLPQPEDLWELSPGDEPSDVGSRTVRLHHESLDFGPPAEGGSEPTNPVTPVIPVSEAQLERIERRLAELGRALQQLEERVEAIDSVLARVLNR